MAQEGRVQVREFEREARLAPAPVVNVQTVAPMNRQGEGNNLLRIAESLASLSPTVARFAQTQKARQAEENEYLAGQLSGKTSADLKTYFDSNPDLLKDKKIALMYAGKVANDFGRSIPQLMADPNRDPNMPVDQYIAQAQAEAAKQFGDDPMLTAFFNQNVAPFREGWLREDAKLKADEAQTQTVDVLRANMDNVVVQGQQGKVPPADTAQAVFASLNELPAFKNLTGPQRTELIYTYAKSIDPKSEEDLALIDALLNSQRPDGVPPISDDLNFRDKASLLREQKMSDYRKSNSEAQTSVMVAIEETIASGGGIAGVEEIKKKSGNLFSDDYWQSVTLRANEAAMKLTEQQKARNAHNAEVDKAREEAKKRFGTGTAFSDAAFVDVTVPDPDKPGKSTTYSGKQLKEDVKNDILNSVSGLEAPEEVKWGLTANIFGKANETISQWEDAFSATPTSMTAASAAKDIPDQMVTNAKLYDYLKDSGNYLYLDAHMKGDGTRQFWTMYDSFRGSGQNEREALFSTYKVLNDPNALASAREEVNFARGTYFKSGQSFAETELDGDSVAAAQVMSMATALTATRRKPTEALETALKIYKDTHEYVQGAWVPKNLKGLPDNFKDNMESYVGETIKQYGAKANPPIDDPEDVMIAPDASGQRFYFFQKSTGLPLMAKSARGGVSRTGIMSVTIQTLSDYDKLKNDRAAIPMDKERADMQDAIANPETKVIGGGRTRPMEVQKTPQEIVQEKREKEAEGRKQKQKELSDQENAKSPVMKPEKDLTMKERIRAARDVWGLGNEMPDEQVIKFLQERGAIPK